MNAAEDVAELETNSESGCSNNTIGSRQPEKEKKNRPTKAGEINFDAIGSCKERLILIPKLISKLVECCFFTSWHSMVGFKM